MRLIVFESTDTERNRMFVQELPNGELRAYVLPNKEDSLVSSIYYPNWNEIDEKKYNGKIEYVATIGTFHSPWKDLFFTEL